MNTNTETQHFPEIMGREEAAKFIGVSPKGLINYVNRKLIPEIKLGKRRLYRRSALLEALKRLEVPAEIYK